MVSIHQDGGDEDDEDYEDVLHGDGKVNYDLFSPLHSPLEIKRRKKKKNLILLLSASIDCVRLSARFSNTQEICLDEKLLKKIYLDMQENCTVMFSDNHV